MTYTFEFMVYDDQDNIVFSANKPTLELLQEEIGRWEQHKEKFINEHEAKNS